jgi:hypothetical protein
MLRSVSMASLSDYLNTEDDSENIGCTELTEKDEYVDFLQRITVVYRAESSADDIRKLRAELLDKRGNDQALLLTYSKIISQEHKNNDNDWLAFRGGN